MKHICVKWVVVIVANVLCWAEMRTVYRNLIRLFGRASISLVTELKHTKKQQRFYNTIITESKEMF